jgi:cytochrome c-type biogenesis protein CcmF
MEKRGALPGWTVFLALAAFTFSMLGAFLVRSGVLTSVHAFAVDPKRGILLLSILGIAAGTGFALFAWRGPRLAAGGLFAPISREGALVINNLVLSAATATVLLGTLYPLIKEALTGQTLSVGTPYFNLTFAPLMALALVVLPLGPLMAWKRGDSFGALQRLWWAAVLAVGVAIAALALLKPTDAFAAIGIGLGVWLIAGALVEVAERVHLGRASAHEVRRRLIGLPRGAWGTTLAHAGLGLFALGASIETAYKIEAAKPLGLNQSLNAGAYVMTLTDVDQVEGPNYVAERGTITVTRQGRLDCTATPERRFYPAGRQTTSEVYICLQGLSDVYLVLGERRTGLDGQPTWLVRGYWNPWARLIFFGPLLMALGGLISLTDRRLRLAAPRRAKVAEAAQ